MIVTSSQGALNLKWWLCDRIRYTPPPDLVCIGNLFDGRVRGVVGYDNFTGGSIQMHAAGEGNWFTKDFAYAVFDYPFNVCKVNMVIGLIDSGNKKIVQFTDHIGFDVQARLKDAGTKGDLLVISMPRANCRFLRSNHG